MDLYPDDSEFIDECIADNGFFINGIAGIAIYSSGFYLNGKSEIVCTVGSDDLFEVFNRICMDYSIGKLPIDKVFNCKYMKIDNKLMRCILRTQTIEDSIWIRDNIATAVKYRSPDFSNFIIMQISDPNNILPGEKDYTYGDQNVSMLKSNIDAVHKQNTAINEEQ